MFLTVNVNRLRRELGRLDLGAVERLSDLLYRAWEEGRSVFLAGNGGSACTCSHFAADWGKNTVPAADVAEGGRRLKILSLTDNVAWITALANDYSYSAVFVEQLMHYAAAGDLLVAVSGSGNSPNVLRAVEWAKRHGLTVYAMTGYDGGQLKTLQHHGLHVAVEDMGTVETIHLAVGHWVGYALAARIAGGSRPS